MPALIKSRNKLRAFGGGEKMQSMCHVDNLCHALILGSIKLNSSKSKCAGKCYFCTDGGAFNLWDAVDYLNDVLPKTVKIKNKYNVPLFVI